jgi:prolyl-tRNA synthetase
MGGSGAHEFMVLNEFGEDTIVLCDSAATPRTSDRRGPEAGPRGGGRAADGGRRDAGATTIEAWRRSSDFPTSRTAKAAFFVTGDGRFVVAIVRGDYDVNETKLVNAIKATGGLRPAQSRRSSARGMQAGYGSPIGAAIRRRRRRARSCARRTSLPARTASAGT